MNTTRRRPWSETTPGLLALALLALALAVLVVLPGLFPADAQTFSSQPWYRSGVYELLRAPASILFRIDMTSSGTYTFSGGSFTTSSGVITSGDVRAGSGNAFYWSGRSQMTSPADSNIRLTNAAGTAFGLLQFGGTTAAFPALKRDATTLRARFADDSSDSKFMADNIELTGNGGVLLSNGGASITMAPGGFAALGAPGNGTIKYCSDCTFANPCAGGGTGAFAKRLNGAWRCD